MEPNQTSDPEDEDEYSSSEEEEESNEYINASFIDVRQLFIRFLLHCTDTNRDTPSQPMLGCFILAFVCNSYTKNITRRCQSSYFIAFQQGYWCKKSLIAAQGPLPDTRAEFLRILYQQQTKTLVMLTDCKEDDKVKHLKIYLKLKKTIIHIFQYDYNISLQLYFSRTIALSTGQMKRKCSAR